MSNQHDDAIGRYAHTFNELVATDNRDIGRNDRHQNVVVSLAAAVRDAQLVVLATDGGGDPVLVAFDDGRLSIIRAVLGEDRNDDVVRVKQFGRLADAWISRVSTANDCDSVAVTAVSVHHASLPHGRIDLGAESRHQQTAQRLRDALAKVLAP